MVRQLWLILFLATLYIGCIPTSEEPLPPPPTEEDLSGVSPAPKGGILWADSATITPQKLPLYQLTNPDAVDTLFLIQHLSGVIDYYHYILWEGKKVMVRPDDDDIYPFLSDHQTIKYGIVFSVSRRVLSSIDFLQ